MAGVIYIAANWGRVHKGAATGGSVHQRNLHGGRPMGCGGELHCGGAFKGVVSDDAGDLRQGYYSR